MHKINAEDCTACGICADTCPEEAIIDGPDAYIITDACTDCGTCVDACPMEAISA